MSQLDPLKSFMNTLLGQRVDRAAAAITGSAAANVIFTVTGGRVIVTNIIGEITIGASGATNLRLQGNPTTGTTAVLCGVLAAGALEVGTLLSITGTPGDAMYGVSAGHGKVQTLPMVIPIGGIEVTSSAAETISAKWSVTWIPLDDGASLVAA
jgi:hypothetical protein